MMAPSDIDDGHRRTALALLGLAKADRKWLLVRLPDDARERVVAMLRDLERMKLPPQQLAEVAGALEGESEVVAAHLSEPGQGAGPGDAAGAGIASTTQPALAQPAVEPDDPPALLARAEAAVIHRALRDEPDALVARVLALHDWPWTADLCGMLGKTRATRIAALRRDAAPLPAAVAQALVEGLLARVGAAHRRAFAGELQAAQQQSRRERRWTRWLR